MSRAGRLVLKGLVSDLSEEDRKTYDTKKAELEKVTADLFEPKASYGHKTAVYVALLVTSQEIMIKLEERK